MKKYNIGYTTGVFDLFHIGHLNLLRNAKEQCEYLIVGVSTDALVKEYKHRCPFISFEERKAIVQAIRYVDDVVPQTSLDKIEAWEKLHFNALFHGDDWKGTELYNDIEKKLGKHGVAVEYLPHTNGISSADIKKKLSDK